MKKLISVLIIAVMLVAFASLPISATRGYSLDATYGTPVIDGKIDDIWNQNTSVAKVSHANNDDPKGSNNSAEVKVMWDENNIYFLVVAKDDTLDPENDIFEFYLDEKFDKSPTYNAADRQTRLSVNGTIHDSTKDDDGNDTTREALYNSSKYTTTSDGWILEVSLKWTGLVDIKPDMVMGLEFMWDDKPAGVAWRWNIDTKAGDKAPYQTTEGFAPLTLKAPVIVEAPKTDKDNGGSNAAQTADPITVALVAIAIAGTGIVIGKKRK